ncbi:MAG: SpoIIE family protein phosphatase [Vicinamibacterales bacterium]
MRSRPLRTFAVRILIIGIALKLAALAAAMMGILSAAVLRGVDVLGDLALLGGAAGFAILLLRLARQRLLWRVRRQLILSYVFIGVIPALLLVTFFVLAGVLLFANIGSYLIQTRVRTLIEEVRVVAEAAGRTVTGAATDQIAGSMAAEFAREQATTFPGLSLVFMPLPARCAAPAAAPPDPAGAATQIVAGDWAHLPRPEGLPEWVPCEGYASLVTGANGARPDTEHAAIRAVVPSRGPSGAGVVILDVPLGDAILRRLGEDTGTQLGDMAALPAPSTGLAVGNAETDINIDPIIVNASSGRLTDLLRWVAFLDYTDWMSGNRGTVGLAIGLSVSRLYARISATPLASLGNFSFGQLLLAGLMLVAALFLIIQSVAFVMGLVLARSITGSVHELFEGTERVRTGDFSHKIAVHQRDQLGELAESFNTMTASIETLMLERVEKQRLEQELALARTIQMSLLPQAPLRLPGIIVSAHCEPAREVGGDYYDYLLLSPTRAGILIADVAGKGTSAALYMAELKGVVHSLSRTAGSPRNLLIEANRIIAPHLDDRSFITMTYAVVDSEQRTFTYARAGHCPLVYVPGGASHRNGSRAGIMAPSGMVLGLKLDSGEMFERVLVEATIPLGSGDVLVLFTDGISEAMNVEGDCFGEQRLMELVEEHVDADVDRLRGRILDDIRVFSHGAPQHDDMTMLVLKVGPPPQVEARP